MANVIPPATSAGTPLTIVLSSGSTLFRVHQGRFASQAFNPGPSHQYYGGGRFDGTVDDPFGFMYGGETVMTAIAETMLRDLPFEDTGSRQLTPAAYSGRRLSAVTFTHDVKLVDLRSSLALSQVAQDTWLTTADTRDYAQTRHWSHWIRARVPHAAGFVWLSRREQPQLAYVLFEDRMGVASVVDDPSHPELPTPDERNFDLPQGRVFLRSNLARYNVTLSP